MYFDKTNQPESYAENFFSAKAFREKAFRTLIENLAEPIAWYDASGLCLFANKAHRTLFHSIPDEKGRAGTLFHSKGYAAYCEAIEKAVIRGTDFQQEFLFEDADNHQHWLSVRFIIQRDSNGILESVFSIATDITNGKKLEQEWQTQQRVLHTLVENSPDPMVRFDLKGRRLYVNAAQCKVTCLSLEEQLGKTPAAYSTLGKAAPRYQEWIEEAVASETAIFREMEWVNPLGIRYWHEVTFTPERNECGAVESVLMVARDITRQKKTEQLLLAREQELRSILENTPDSIVRYDRECRRIFVNSTYGRITGGCSQDYLDKKPTEIGPFVSKEDAEGYQKLVCKVMESGKMHEMCYPWQKPDGTTGWMDIRMLPEYGPDGQIVSALSLFRDNTKIKETERQLLAREQELRSILENSPDSIVRYDRECRRVFVNSTHERTTGICLQEYLYKTPTEIGPLSKGAAEHYQELVLSVLETGKPCEKHLSWQKPDGTTGWADARILPEYGVDGQIVSALCITRDVTSLRIAEECIENAEAVAQMGHWHCDLSANTCFFSKGACHLLKKDGDWSPTVREILKFIPLHQRKPILKATRKAISINKTEMKLECTLSSKPDDQHLFCHVSIEYSAEGMPAKMSGILQDVSATKSYQQQLQTLAYQDSLTGLPNRTEFSNRFKQAISEAVAIDHSCGFMLLDLDNFKSINDTFGHAFGDQLLCAVGERIRGILREYDTVARLGGDEFAIILPEIPGVSALHSIARKIIKIFSSPFFIYGFEMMITCSIGVVICPFNGTDTENLLQYADSAMYHAKESGRNNYQFYYKELTSRIVERSLLESALRQALKNGELEMYYQPQVAVNSGEICGVEALMRWNHPTMGLVPPDQFIGIAEDTGLIVEMGAWALQEVVRVISDWNHGGETVIRGAVNLSPRQFMDDTLVTTVQTALKQAKCRPEWIELEITESLLADKQGYTRKALETFHDMGLGIAIDDFGTGYSSLSYLTSFPVDTLKIDRSFISEVTINPDHAVLVKAICSMAQSLNITLLAEGVETVDQEAFLDSLACPLAQGYLYAKPMPLSDLKSFLANKCVQLCNTATQ